MIQTIYLKNNTLVQHYSDAGFLLLQNETGEKYADPVDLVPCRYTYAETNEPIEDGGITGDEVLEMIKEVL